MVNKRDLLWFRRTESTRPCYSAGQMTPDETGRCVRVVQKPPVQGLEIRLGIHDPHALISLEKVTSRIFFYPLVFSLSLRVLQYIPLLAYF